VKGRKDFKLKFSLRFSFSEKEKIIGEKTTSFLIAMDL